METKEPLVVASKVKKYVKESGSGMNTSAAVIDILTEKVKRLLDAGIECAKKDKRKTLMDRDLL
jgi:histone H3/H4